MAHSGFFDTSLDDVSMKRATRNIGENEESRTRGLQKLKEKIQNTENLHSRLDDHFLLRFLRVAKFDPDKAFDRLHHYYSTRKQYPHVFDHFCPSATTTAQPAHHSWAAPRRDTDNSVVISHKRGLFDPSCMVFEEMFLLDLLILDYLTDNNITQICGLTAIIDFDGYGWRHLIEDTPSRVRMVLTSFQNTFPMRFKEVHIINAPTPFKILYSLAYPFLSKKIKNRIHIHSNVKDLVSFLPANVVPVEYGGNVPESDLIDLVEEVIQKEEYYKEQLQYGYLKTS